MEFRQPPHRRNHHHLLYFKRHDAHGNSPHHNEGHRNRRYQRQWNRHSQARSSTSHFTRKPSSRQGQRAGIGVHSRNGHPAHHMRYYAQNLFSPSALHLIDGKSRHAQITGPHLLGRRCNVQRRQHHQPQTGESDDGWRTVSYRGRRHHFHPKRRFPSLPNTNSEINWAAEKDNRYHLLRLGNEIPTHPTEFDFESDTAPPVNETHRTRENNRGIVRKVRRDGPNRRQRKPSKCCGPNRRPATATPVAPTISSPGPSPDKAIATLLAPSVNCLDVDETHSAGNAQFTWAEIVRNDTDKQHSKAVSILPQAHFSKEKSIIPYHMQMDSAEIIQAMPDAKDTEKFYFFGEQGFDSIKLESAVF
ncbi:unnamed protein product [Cuscuta epithymum]|uniref:Uncharacterized protein n=1 Tax=Cuscuta epithymum TaxID=186058 RepID=A0AAV0FPL8_9ASTE|nr:unnamed protein product [Cuscuta epithymum]